MQQYLEAGKVVTTHGVRGEMKLELWCDGVDFLKKAGRLFPSAQGGRAYKITSIRPQGQMALLQLEGVNDMDAARALRGQVFYFDRNDATLPAGRWYVADLIGCEVRAASTSATALRASFLPLNFLRRGFSGCAGALYCGCSGGVGGTLPPSAGAVSAGRAGCASGSLYWFAVFMPLLPTLG